MNIMKARNNHMDNLKYLEHVVELGKVQAATTPEEMSGAFDAFNGFLGLYYDLAKMELQKAGIDTPPIRNFAIDKALERIEPAAFNENPHINGLLISSPTAGDSVSSPTPTALAAALDVMKELDGTGLLEHIRVIDVEKEYDMSIWYDERYEIKLGGTDELAYKIRYLCSILEQLSEFQAGTIDLTQAAQKKATFQPAA